MRSGTGGIVLMAAVVLAVGIPVFRVARRRARRSGGIRALMIVGGLVVLGGATALWPWVFHLEPPWSESPSGLILIVGRGVPLGLVSIAAAATFVGAVFASVGGGQHRGGHDGL
jgi:hypothetical protein